MATVYLKNIIEKKLETRYAKLLSKVQKSPYKKWATRAHIAQGKLHLHRREFIKARGAYVKAQSTLQQYQKYDHKDKVGIAICQGQIYYGLAMCEVQGGMGKAKQSRSTLSRGNHSPMGQKKVLDLLEQAKKQYTSVEQAVTQSGSQQGWSVTWLRDYAKVLDMEIECRIMEGTRK